MENYVSAIPAWVITLFVVSFVYCLSFLAKPAKQAALNAGMTIEKSRNIQFGVFIFFVLWLAYVSLLSLKGIFYVNSMPPNIVIYAVLPLTIILFAVIGNTALYKRLLQSASLESLIRIHVFRLVGIFFIFIYLYQLLPAQLAIPASMGDIITAIFAIPVANAVSQKRSWSTKAIYAWNILGIIDILVVVISAILVAKKDLLTGEHGDLELTIFPFVWFPAFAPATILFLHWGVFKKLQQAKQANPTALPGVSSFG